MDIFDYRASRVVNTEGVFVATSNDTEIGGLFMRLKNVMVSELHLQWDLAFLEQYVTEGMIPRSLRWDVHPQQGEVDLDSWFTYFNDAGIKFLDFLINRKRIRLSVLDQEIKELKDKLLTHKNSVEYNTLSSNLQAHLIKEDKEQKTKNKKSIPVTTGITKRARYSDGRNPLQDLLHSHPWRLMSTARIPLFHPLSLRSVQNLM